MDTFLYFLISGLCIGSIYALIALGYTLVYGIIKLINFAHGEFYMVGAYAGYGIYYKYFKDTEISPWLSIPVILFVSGAAGAAVAVLTEWIAYKPIRKAGRLAALLTAIGVSFFLQNAFTQIDSGNPQNYKGVIDELAQHSVSIGSSGIKTIRLIFIPVTILLTGILWWIVQKTRTGKAMRAVSQDPDAAALMGINIDSIVRRTFILGGVLAGIGGTLVGMQSTITPYMGFLPGLKAFVAAVIGGIGSIPGAVIGGFLIGVVENLALWAGIDSGYKDVAAFVILILVILVRPQGLLGTPEREKV